MENSMAQVTIKINGYAYTLGCEDGQEEHLQAMAEQVEGRIESIKAIGGNSGEARLLVLASLLMADELHDLKAEMKKLQANPSRPVQTPKANGDLALTLGKLATRAEEIASSLEAP
jgi:cell division protein ZapA